MEQSKLIANKTFQNFRQGVSLYKKGKALYMVIEDLDLGAKTPIHNVTKKLYKSIVKNYDLLDALVAAQKELIKDLMQRNIKQPETQEIPEA